MAELRQRSNKDAAEVSAPEDDKKRRKIEPEPDWGFVEIGKLIAMGLMWGVVVLGVIHLSMWLGAWWDNNIGTPGKPGWRSQKIFQ
ncbi:g9020 [Coccomyxa viridis]|uniref:G9020 protein n=1 Tax=Coccomyxa viridis TaxID=1274662 RepID=A0ABP1G4F9_9CHLO